MRLKFKHLNNDDTEIPRPGGYETRIYLAFLSSWTLSIKYFLSYYSRKHFGNYCKLKYRNFAMLVTPTIKFLLFRIQEQRKLPTGQSYTSICFSALKFDFSPTGKHWMRIVLGWLAKQVHRTREGMNWIECGVSMPTSVHREILTDRTKNLR
jgi:hypothetical protein